MSQSSGTHGPSSPLQAPVPAWLGAGLIGLVLGAGSTLVVMRSYATASPGSTYVDPEPGGDVPQIPPANRGGEGGMGGMMGGGGMGGGGMGAGGGGGMGGGGGGGFGGGGPGGGAARAKRNLTTLVGKLDLLLGGSLHVELTPEQSAKLSAQLSKLDLAEKLTADEAQSELEAMEALFSAEQKAVVDSIGLPFGRPGGGAPGGGGGGGGFGGGGPGGPGGGEDDNPFSQEMNQKRLTDLLGRVKPAAGTAEATSPPAEPAPAADKPAAEEKPEQPK